MGADADLRIAVSPALAAAAQRPGAGLLSGDTLTLPDPLDEQTVLRVLDALQEGGPSAASELERFASTEAASRVATTTFETYVAARAQHLDWAGVEASAIADACALGTGGAGGGRSDLERLAASFGFAEWAAMQDAPLFMALRWLHARSAHSRLQAEGS